MELQRFVCSVKLFIRYSVKAGGVMWSFVLSFVLSMSRITNECRPNVVGKARGDPLKLITFWNLYGSEYESRISFSLSLILGDRHFCHSPEGDTAAALANGEFYAIYAHSSQGDNTTAVAEFALCECSYSFIHWECCCKARGRSSTQRHIHAHQQRLQPALRVATQARLWKPCTLTGLEHCDY